MGQVLTKETRGCGIHILSEVLTMVIHLPPSSPQVLQQLPALLDSLRSCPPLPLPPRCCSSCPHCCPHCLTHSPPAVNPSSWPPWVCWPQSLLAPPSSAPCWCRC